MLLWGYSPPAISFLLSGVGKKKNKIATSSNAWLGPWVRSNLFRVLTWRHRPAGKRRPALMFCLLFSWLTFLETDKPGGNRRPGKQVLGCLNQRAELINSLRGELPRNQELLFEVEPTLCSPEQLTAWQGGVPFLCRKWVWFPVA